MDQDPRICWRCQQANFPIAEFCRHCGEPLFPMGSISRSSLLTRLVGHIIDGLSWTVSECARWREIGRINFNLKELRGRRTEFMKKVGIPAPNGGLDFNNEDRKRLVELSDEISRLSSREEYLRNQCWALTPELLLFLLAFVFMLGLYFVKPRMDTSMLDVRPPAAIEGMPVKTVKMPLAGYSVVTASAWFDGKFYIGGDGGLSVFDPVTGELAKVQAFAPDFFIRDMIVEPKRLLIAGYGGVYAFDRMGFSPVYDGEGLPIGLVNRIASTKDGGHLLGTIGHGLMKGNGKVALVLLGSSGLTIRDFSWLDDELWVVHERGILKGDGSSFTNFDLPILSGKDVRKIETKNDVVYFAADKGLITGIRNGRSWNWTQIRSSETSSINEILVAETGAAICSDQGLYIYRNNELDKISDLPAKTGSISGRFLATAHPDQVVFYEFPSGTVPAINITPQIDPVIGTFSPEILPMPKDQPAPAIGKTGRIPNVQPREPETGFTAKKRFTLDFSDIPEELRSLSLSGIARAGEQIWVATEDSGLWFYRNSGWTAFNRGNGGLKDNQIVSLNAFEDNVYFYSWMTGIFSMVSGRPELFVNPGRLNGYIDFAVDENRTLLLFSDGYVKEREQQGDLKNFSQIPEGFFRSARKIFILNRQLLVITDTGLLVYGEGNRWELKAFERHSLDARVSCACLDKNRNVFIALSDGSIHSYDSRDLKKLGDIGERPRCMTYSDFLWVAGATDIFKWSAGSFNSAVDVTERTDIVGMLVMSSEGIILAATTSGLRQLHIKG